MYYTKNSQNNKKSKLPIAAFCHTYSNLVLWWSGGSTSQTRHKNSWDCQSHATWPPRRGGTQQQKNHDDSLCCDVGSSSQNSNKNLHTYGWECNLRVSVCVNKFVNRFPILDPSWVTRSARTVVMSPLAYARGGTHLECCGYDLHKYVVFPAVNYGNTSPGGKTNLVQGRKKESAVDYAEIDCA